MSAQDNKPLAENAVVLESLPVITLKGVGPRQTERLAHLGIKVVADLLFHLPLRYQDRTRLVPMGSLRPGDEVTVEGEVQLTELKYAGRRTLLSRMTDGTGSITLRFFHFSAAQQKSLSRGTRLRCFGEVRKGAATLEMIHPEYRFVAPDEAVEESLTPIYPATEGLQQQSLRRLTEQALAHLKQGAVLQDYLPVEYIRALSLPPLVEAIEYLHCPPPDAPVSLLMEGMHPAQQRLAFEELLAHHLSLRQLRLSAQQHVAPAFKNKAELSMALLQSLPFHLTSAQQRVTDEISADMEMPLPMQRLVQGDVGSGKTIVAAMAVLQAIESGFQAAVMAPTELLAEQHYQNFCHWLEPLGIGVAWLSGKLKVGQRRQMQEVIVSGEAMVVVGTHALFQEGVDFFELGLIVVDEQHRFGVHQRLALREKGQRDGRYPHQLIMTATPIPRTLAMTAYADLDVSVIDELPPGRSPIETVVLPESRRDTVVQRVESACREGRQAYWVCTLIEESETLQCQAAEASAEALAEALPDLKVGLVHGRMKAEQKTQLMAAFKAGEINLLVATTVIEVGVDVPNASLMIIENAERLGLAQLHQLRGRVGRGKEKSSCVLMYHGSLSRQARERLAVLRESSDGFVIAQKDLELRGPGELLGTRQTGMLQLRIADLQRDQALLNEVANVAACMLREQPEKVPLIIQRWLGDGARYGDV